MLSSTGTMMLLFSAAAIVPVIASVSNLTVARQRDSYALWQLVGVNSHAVRNVVLIQLCMTAVIGALVGAIAALVFYEPLFPILFPDLMQPAGSGSSIGLSSGLTGIVNTLLLSALLYVLGGLGSAKKASRTSPIEALSELERPVPKVPWLRLIVLVACLGVTGYLLTYVQSDDVGLVTNGTFLLPLAVVACVASLAPWILHGMLHLWSFPLRPFVIPNLAKKEADFALASSTSIELPVAIGFGIVVGIYSSLSLLGEWYATHSLSWDPTLNQTARVVFFGCPIVICLVGALASTLISSGEHSRNTASLMLMGMTAKEALAASLLEALLHTVNSLLTGSLTACISVGLISLAFGISPVGHLELVPGLPVCLAGLVFVALVLCASTFLGIHAATTNVSAASRGIVE